MYLSATTASRGIPRAKLNLIQLRTTLPFGVNKRFATDLPYREAHLRPTTNIAFYAEAVKELSVTFSSRQDWGDLQKINSKQGYLNCHLWNKHVKIMICNHSCRNLCQWISLSQRDFKKSNKLDALRIVRHLEWSDAFSTSSWQLF